jgi:hypothetical protein
MHRSASARSALRSGELRAVERARPAGLRLVGGVRRRLHASRRGVGRSRSCRSDRRARRAHQPRSLDRTECLDGRPDAEGEPRFRMLETIREFARDQRLEPEGIRLRDRHLAYFVALAERSEPQLRGPDQAAWIRRLAAEQADIRAALAWAQKAHRDESMLRLAAALKRRFWHDAGGLGEGLRWLEASLAVAADAPAALRVKAQQRLAWIVWEMGDSDRSQELFEASLAAADDDDHRSRIEALIGLSHRALGTGGSSSMRPRNRWLRPSTTHAMTGLLAPWSSHCWLRASLPKPAESLHGRGRISRKRSTWRVTPGMCGEPPARSPKVARSRSRPESNHTPRRCWRRACSCRSRAVKEASSSRMPPPRWPRH